MISLSRIETLNMLPRIFAVFCVTILFCHGVDTLTWYLDKYTKYQHSLKKQSHHVDVFINHFINACFHTVVLGNMNEYSSFMYVVFLKFIVAQACSSILFYIVHRMLHTKYLYKAIHSKHHSYTVPVATSSMYMTRTELVCANILSTMLPTLLLKMSPRQANTYILYNTLAVSFYHCRGLVFGPTTRKILGWGSSHLRHHWMRGMSKNLGLIDGVLDKLLHTNVDTYITEEYKLYRPKKYQPCQK